MAQSFIQRLGGCILIVGFGLVSAPFALADNHVVLAAVAIEATPGTICVGQSARISWTSLDATSVSIDQGFGAVPLSGERYVSPTQTTSYTITGSNSTGSTPMASATVFVSPAGSCATPTPVPTPTITPTPFPPTASLYCSATYGSVYSGDLATFTAWGGTGSYTWSAPEGSPFYGYGSTFATRFYSQIWYPVSRSVVVTSGGQSTSCPITVNPAIQPPVWTPTPLPPVQPVGQLQVVKMGRNVTRGQSGEYASVSARDGDTLTFVIRVRSVGSSYLTNVLVSDILPSELTYIAGSTRVNGIAVADGLVPHGLNVGSLYPSSEAVVEFSARVHGPTWQALTVNNTARARADGIGTHVALLPITLGQYVGVATASQVKTGVADSALIALLASLVVTMLYSMYVYSAGYARKMNAEDLKRAMRKQALNFSR